MDHNETPKNEERSSESLGRMFVRSTVSSAAVWTGLGLVLFIASKISNIWEARKAKKNPPTTEN
jgi:hypothetical protein